jgi:hypothetical protein
LVISKKSYFLKMENRKKELKDVIVFIMDYLNEVVGM